MLVSSDPEGARKSGMKAEKGHMPGTFPETLAVYDHSLLQGIDGLVMGAPGALVRAVPQPSRLGSPSVRLLQGLLLPQIHCSFPPSLPPSFLSY